MIGWGTMGGWGGDGAGGGSGRNDCKEVERLTNYFRPQRSRMSNRVETINRLL